MANWINKLEQAQKNGLKVDEFFRKGLLEMIALEKKEMVFQTLGDTESLPKNSGTTTITFRRYLHLPVEVKKHLLTEGVAPESGTVEGIKVSGKVKQYGYVLKITDVTDTVHMDKIFAVYNPELARHAAELRERVIIESFAEASEHFVGGAVNAAGLKETDVINFKALREVRLAMKVNKRKGHKKVSGSYPVVVTYNGLEDLLDDKDLLDKMLATGNQNSPIKNASLEGYKVYDMFITASNVLEPKKEGGFNVYPAVMLGADGFKYLELDGLKWLKTDFSAEKTDPLAQIATVGYKAFFGAKVIDPLAVHVIHARSGFDEVVDAKDVHGRPAKQETGV